jgi:hypothetical protein
MKHLVSSMLIAFSVADVSPEIASADPYGPAFVVNSSTAGFQMTIGTATGANGDTAILWQDGGTYDAKYLMRYDAAGRPLQSDSWYVGLDAVDVAVSGSGSFAILDGSSDGSDLGVYVTVYSRSGSVLVPKFRVNDTTTGRQLPQSIAMNASGQFAVTWLMGGYPTYGIYVKRYQANGTPITAETQVTPPGLWAEGAEVAVDNTGAFVISWTQRVQGYDFDIYMRRYSSTGYSLGPASLVNTFTLGMQAGSRIAMSGTTGAFVIVWPNLGQTGSSCSLNGQRFNANGTPSGGEFQISAPSASPPFPSVAMASNGSFMAAWTDDNRLIDPSSVPRLMGRNYDGNGVPFSAPYLITQLNHNQVWAPYTTMDPSGNAVVSSGQADPSNNVDVYAQRFLPAGVTAQALANGELVTGVSGAAGSWRYFKITVPPGHTTLDVAIAGSTGDADLYVRRGALPTQTSWDGRPYLYGSNESVRMLGYPPGDWYIGINGYSAYSGLTLRATSY